ncbi:MAG: hypothetical protein V1859_06200 [archaeon]
MKKHEKNDSKKKINVILIVSLLAIIGIAASFAVFNSSKKSGVADTGINDSEVVVLAKCLTEKGYAMAGSESCSHCKAQKARFGDAFKYVRYYNCPVQRDLCDNKNYKIQGYPTWIAPDSLNYTIYVGEKELFDLAEISGCPYTTTGCM